MDRETYNELKKIGKKEKEERERRYRVSYQKAKKIISYSFRKELSFSDYLVILGLLSSYKYFDSTTDELIERAYAEIHGTDAVSGFTPEDLFGL